MSYLSSAFSGMKLAQQLGPTATVSVLYPFHLNMEEVPASEML
jgi:hypothetical protein